MSAQSINSKAPFTQYLHKYRKPSNHAYWDQRLPAIVSICSDTILYEKENKQVCTNTTLDLPVFLLVHTKVIRACKIYVFPSSDNVATIPVYYPPDKPGIFI